MAAETQIIISAKDLASDVFLNVGRQVDSLKHKLELAERYIPFAGVASAAFLGGEALKEMVEHTIENMHHMEILGQQVGMTVEQLTQFSYVAYLADTSTETFAKSVERLSKNMLGASGGIQDGMDAMSAGGNKVRAALTAMGFSQKDILDGLKNMPEFLGKLADKFSSYEDGAIKTGLAMMLFGKAGAGMIPVLNKGSEAFREMFAEARATGNVFSEKVAKQAEEVVDNFKRLHYQISGVNTEIVTGLLPTFASFSEVMLETKGDTNALREAMELVDAIIRSLIFDAIVVKNAVEIAGASILSTGGAIYDFFNGDLSGAYNNLQGGFASIKEDILDVGHAWDIFIAKKHAALSDEGAGHGKTKKGQAPIPNMDNGKGADTLKTLAQEAYKLEESLTQVRGTYMELTLTLQGDTYGATLMKNQVEYDKANLETLKEFQKIQDERKALSQKGKLSGEAKYLLDRQEAAVLGKMYWQPFVQAEKDALAQIQDDLEKMAHEAAHITAMSGFTGQGVYEAQVQAINAKYDALRKDPKTKQFGADWDAEQTAALTRARQDNAKAIAGQRAELAQLTGSTREYYLAQAEILAIDYQLAQTDADRALKAEQYARVMAQANGDWIHASKTAMQEYARDAGDTWKQVNTTVGAVATDMENYMVDSAMGTKNAWASACASIERDFIRMLTRMGPMNKAMTMAGGFISGGLEDLFGGSSWAKTSNADMMKAYEEAGGFGGSNPPAFASGGYTPSSGPILVGEHGPEIFNPGGPGYVYNNGQTQAMLGGGPVSNNIRIVQNFDFRGADTGTETRIRGMLGTMKQQAVAEAVAQVQAQANRGGKFSKTVGRRQ